MITKPNKLIFDVESTELYGLPFAVGAIVADKNNIIIDQFSMVNWQVANSNVVSGWVRQNVLPALVNFPGCQSGRELRDAFYEFYMKHAGNCTIWSDVNYPVETNFLFQVTEDARVGRQFTMPYPLYDIAHFVPVDVNRIEACGVPDLVAHNPLHDSIASFNCLLKSENYQAWSKSISAQTKTTTES